MNRALVGTSRCDVPARARVWGFSPVVHSALGEVPQSSSNVQLFPASSAAEIALFRAACALGVSAGMTLAGESPYPNHEGHLMTTKNAYWSCLRLLVLVAMAWVVKQAWAADTGIPIVHILATDPCASETGQETATFTVFRTGSTNAPLTVQYRVGGT